MCRRGNGPTPRARLRGPRAPRRGAPNARPTNLHPDGSGDPGQRGKDEMEKRYRFVEHFSLFGKKKE
ncbi:hypothetical protein MJG53_010382 [Ovis ammon polii x Ovis aries]|uniref:Uncharacterized protein n=1 Tax=Ovis ammon polii x Ovis aries TaxID=2918886 RepID=A0ACB9UU95_9CETA|nr:hypothetical protein MJG53_010382 [Ovis ammon polii x Ovis aries]